MARQQIRAALEGRLKTLTPEWPTAWENVRFNRKDVIGQSWQKSDLMFGQTMPLGFAAGSGEEWTGLYQVTLFTPTSDGPAAADARAAVIRGDIASSVVGHFYRGQNLTSGGITVTVLQPYDGPVQEEEHWWGFPVKIPFTAFAIPY